MKKSLQQRLILLKQEHQKGQERLHQLEAEAANIRDTMLRIQGAIQVLEEELSKSEEGENGHTGESKEVGGEHTS